MNGTKQNAVKAARRYLELKGLEIIDEGWARDGLAGGIDIVANDLGEVVVHARGGARLSEHLNPKTKLGSMTQEALSEGGWTHVVLQERSDGPVRFR